MGKRKSVDIGAVYHAFGAALFDYVNHPDYYKGQWWVGFPHNGRNYKKVCPNYTTALAWVKYLRRQGYRLVDHGRHDPLPGFPRDISDIT